MSLKIDDVELERVNENKFLGIILDHKLSWKPHIAHVQSKLSKTIAILYKTKYLLNTPSLYILYCSLIVPYFSYCVEIWGHTYTTNTKPIFILQKKSYKDS